MFPPINLQQSPNFTFNAAPTSSSASIIPFAISIRIYTVVLGEKCFNKISLHSAKLNAQKFKFINSNLFS